MNDAVWASLTNQLGFVLFARESETGFVPVGVVPEWFRHLCPAATAGQTIDLASHIPFLESFLPEAQNCWAGEESDRVRSGLCAETDEFGNEYFYEMSALKAGGCQVILFELRKDAAEIRETLQKARQNVLDYQLLERTQRALEKSQSELRKARDTAEAATQAKSAFLAHMSHEIRTPMNAVLGLTGLVLQTALESRQKELLEIVRNSAETLLTILNDILDFSKIESGKLDLEREPFDLRHCLEDALDLFAVKAVEKELELSSYTSPDTPGMVVGDVTRLRQILVNLLGNAIKFTTHGEVSLTTTAALMDSGEWKISFAVRDSGIGIPKEKIDRLFQSFSQVDSSVTRKYGGTGLGLAICKNLIELMGGNIQVESQPGAGSVFKFTIAVPAADQIPEPDYLGRVQKDLSGRGAWLIGFKGANLKFLRDQLNWWAVHPEVAETTDEVFAWMRQGRACDIVLLNSLGLHFSAEVLRSLPHPLLEVVPGGSVYDRPKTPGVLSLRSPIKSARLHSALIGVLNPDRDNARPHPATSGRADVEGRKRNLRILLADDNSINQQVGRLILESIGYRADVAANGIEVIEALKCQPYDVILMDVHMPEMDGWETSRRIRSEFPKESQPRIIAMTAGILEEEKRKCVEAGMEDFVSKPIRSAELQRALEKDTAKKHAIIAEAEPSQEEPDFDPEILALLRSANKPGERDFVEELLATYLGLLPGHLKEIRQAAAKRDWKKLEEAAHKLRGSSANLGANPIASVCATLEQLGKTGSAEGMDDAVLKLESLVNRVRQQQSA